MTAKRFIQVIDGVKDTRTGRVLTHPLEITLKLNEINDLYDYVFNRNEDLEKENEQLKQLLDYADDLIQSHLSEHFIRQWRNFKTGHKEYNDFWEEKLKTHKKLKEDLE